MHQELFSCKLFFAFLAQIIVENKGNQINIQYEENKYTKYS